MTKLPSVSVRNAIAFVAELHDFPANCHYATRIQAERHGVQFNMDDGARWSASGGYRPYFVTDEARAIADASPLGRCIAFAKERGFRVQLNGFGGRKAKPGLIRLFNPTTGEDGYISGGARVYFANAAERWKSDLAFDAAKRP